MTPGEIGRQFGLIDLELMRMATSSWAGSALQVIILRRTDYVTHYEKLCA